MVPRARARAAPKVADAAWLGCLALAAATIALYAVVESVAVRDALSFGLSSAVALAVVVGIRVHRPVHATSWWLFAGAATATAVGDGIWLLYEVAAGHAVPFPSAADLAYLCYYPLLGIGLLRLLGPGVRVRAGALVDAVIVTVGAGVLVWGLLVQPFLDDAGLSAVATWVSAAYPLMDLLLLVGLATLVVLGACRTVAMGLLAGSVAATLVSDWGFAALLARDDYGGGSLVELGFLVAAGLLGAAALHPSMAQSPRPRAMALGQEGPPPLGGRIAFVLAAALVGPAVLVGQALLHARVDSQEILAASITVSLLALVRLAGIARDLRDGQRQLAEQQDELVVAAAERRRLLAEMVHVTERERAAVAEELHDGPIQQLIAVGYLLGGMSTQLASSEYRPLLEQVERSLAAEIANMRNLMQRLHPPALQRAGLACAIEDEVAGFERRTDVHCTVDLRLDARLAPSIETSLFRVVQEALGNVRRHAGAHRVRVSLEVEEERGDVALEIHDDGVGFDPAAASSFVANGSFGLALVRERIESVGGTVDVSSDPHGGGTTLVARAPLVGP